MYGQVETVSTTSTICPSLLQSTSYPAAAEVDVATDDVATCLAAKSIDLDVPVDPEIVQVSCLCAVSPLSVTESQLSIVLTIFLTNSCTRIFLVTVELYPLHTIKSEHVTVMCKIVLDNMQAALPFILEGELSACIAE